MRPPNRIEQEQHKDTLTAAQELRDKRTAFGQNSEPVMQED